MSAIREWITFDLVENLIRTSNGDDKLKLKTFTVLDGIGKAENFCSNIVRVAASFCNASSSSNEQTQNFIVKLSLDVDEFDASNDEIAYFTKEIIVYERLLPEAEKLLLSIGDERPIAPRYTEKINRISELRELPWLSNIFSGYLRCLASGEKLNYLIFDDLVSQGFATIDKKGGLDYNHLKLTLTSLAKWHATTAYLYSKVFCMGNLCTVYLHLGASLSE